MLTCYTATSFSVTLRVIPTRQWSAEALTGVDFLSLPSIHSRLDVDVKIDPALKGAFKTAHSGFTTPNGVLPSLLSGNVCVKQVYFLGPGGGVKRYPVTEEKIYIQSQVGCLDWARILLDLTYEFIKDYEEGHGYFPGTIPALCFVEAAIAESDGGKSFLIEEWISTVIAPHH